MLRLRPSLFTLRRGFSAAPVRPMEDVVAARRKESACYARFTRKYPLQIGPLSMEAVDRTARYLTTRGLSHTQALRAISLHVMITRYSQEMMESKIEWLENLGLNHDNVNNIIVRHPIILGFALEKLEALVTWYTCHGVPTNKMAYIFKVFPEGVSFSLENLDSKVDYFRKFGCSNDQIARILMMAPQVLAYSLEKLQVNVNYLMELGVPSEQISAIIARVPQILGLKTIRIKETVDTLNEMFGPAAGVRNLISDSRIVMHNVSGLRRSYKFLLSVGFLQERIEQCTRFITRNDNRILRPRVKFLKTKGLNVLENVSWILMPESQFMVKYPGYAAYMTQIKARPKKRRK